MNPGSDPDVAGSNPGADATREFLFIWHGAVVRASDSEADGLSSERSWVRILDLIWSGSNPVADLVVAGSNPDLEMHSPPPDRVTSEPHPDQIQSDSSHHHPGGGDHGGADPGGGDH